MLPPRWPLSGVSRGSPSEQQEIFAACFYFCFEQADERCLGTEQKYDELAFLFPVK